jgi:dTDP-4-dehydrorhamnose reductase
MSDAVLIVGASGFLGQRLARAFSGRSVVGTFHACPQAGLEFLDLRGPEALRELLRRVAPSIVIYAAGLTDVDACEKNPSLASRLNVEAAAEVAAWGHARTVYLSTDYVFDGKRGFYSEADKVNPLNVYGRTKLAGEREVLDRGDGNLVVRVSGLYDTNGMKGRDFSNPIAPLVSDDMRLSSPVHVEDVASAIHVLLDAGRNGIYHVAGPDSLSRYEFWQLVALRAAAGTTSGSVAAAGTAPRPRDSSLNTQRMEALGWRGRRVCEGLPPLRQKCPVGAGNATPTNRDANGIDALLIDCVGALMTGRTWLPLNDQLEQIDQACAAATNGPEFWKTAADILGIGDADLPELYNRIAFRYAPNPTVWRRLRYWRARYRLALVNNGPAATFRLWVRKYGLDDVFDVLANSEEMGVRKPEREFFLRVANQLGTTPNRCILLDDDPTNVEAARHYGLRAIETIERKSYPLSIHALSAVAGCEVHLGGGSDE